MKRFLTLLVLIILAGSLLAQNDNLNQRSIKQKKYLQKIPYKIIGEHLIVVPVTINGKTYNFLFDTGSSFTISDKLFKELNLPIIDQKGVMDAEGSIKEMRFILLPLLQLQKITFINTLGFVNHEETYDSVNLFECFEIDGIIGSNMFRNSVVQIDEQNKHIIITDDFKKIATKKKHYQALEMELTKIGYPILSWVGINKGEQQSSDTKLLFDTGDPSLYTMRLYAYDWFNENMDIVEIIAESEGSYAWGIHGLFEKERHIILNIPEFRICGKTFYNIVIPTTNSQISRIGSGLLKYGRVTLDYKKKRFFYEPYDDINTDELSERPLAISPTWQNDKLIIGIIWDKSLEAQINLGDEILSIDSINIENISLCDYMKLDVFKKSVSDIKTLELRDIKTGEVKKIEIKRL